MNRPSQRQQVDPRLLAQLLTTTRNVVEDAIDMARAHKERTWDNLESRTWGRDLWLETEDESCQPHEEK